MHFLLIFVVFFGFAVAHAQQDVPFLEQGGQVVIEAENFSNNIRRESHQFRASSESGFSGSGAMRGLPENTKAWAGAWVGRAPELRYPVEVARTGRYHYWVRTYGYGGSSDSIHVGVNGKSIGTVTNVPDFRYAWIALGTANISAGQHTLNLWLRETGVVVDKLLLTTDSSLNPSGIGPAESPRGSGGTANQSPTVEIADPASGSGWLSTDTIALSGSAMDPEDGDLSAGLEWRSNKDGSLGSGADLGVTLTEGAHEVVASVVDGSGATGSAKVSVTVRDPAAPVPDDPPSSGGGSSDGGDSGGSGNSNSQPPSDPGSTGNGPFRELSGTVSFEAEHFARRIAREGHEWRRAIDAAGYSGVEAMRGLPEDTRAWAGTWENRAPELQYDVLIERGGRYEFWVRTHGWGGGSDSIHIGVDGSTVGTVTNVPDGYYAWVRFGAANMNPGQQEINIWIRETGVTVDKIVLAQDSRFVPQGFGPVESPRDGQGSGNSGGGAGGSGNDDSDGQNGDGGSSGNGDSDSNNDGGGSPSGGNSSGGGSSDTDGGTTGSGGGNGSSSTVGDVRLTWRAPTANEDGSRLNDLAGFKIYWGEESTGSYPNSVTVNDPQATQFTVRDLPAGTYEFVATAFNRAGVESRFSNSAVRTVR